jgi:hypothetical protein
VRLAPLTVTVPVRLVVAVFAAALTVTVALLEPDVGETVIQVWSSVAVQLTFDVIENVPDEAAEASASDAVETVSVLAVVPA